MTRTFDPANRPFKNRHGNQTTGWANARQHAHDDIDRIYDHHHSIADLADGRGLVLTGNGGTSSIGDHSDPTLNAVLQKNAAVAWLREYADTQARWARLAQRTHIIDPPPAKHSDRDLELLDLCALCDQPIPRGVEGKTVTRRIATHQGNVPFHATTCYYQLYRRARQENTTPGNLAAQLHAAQQAKRAGQK